MARADVVERVAEVLQRLLTDGWYEDETQVICAVALAVPAATYGDLRAAVPIVRARGEALLGAAGRRFASIH